MRAVLDGHQGVYLFVGRYLDYVDDSPAARRALCFGNFIRPYSEYLALVREQQYVVVRRAYEHFLDEVLFLGAVGCNSHAAAVLGFVFGNGYSLDVARVGHGNYHLLDGYQIRVDYFAVEVDRNFRSSLGGVFALDFKQVVLDYLVYAAFVCEYVLVVGNHCLQLRQLLF